MASEESRFKHVGLSSDGAVIFCELDNGKTYAMPLCALDRAQEWDAKAKPKSTGIIHDGFAAFVKFDNKVALDFPSDFVLHVCEPSYIWYKNKGRAITGVGQRIREIRQSRGLTLDALAAKCGIAKPNLSRLENDRVTPTIETLETVAAALHTHMALLTSAEEPEDAWTWTQYAFGQWALGLHWSGSSRDASVLVPIAEMVKVFLATRPDHRYRTSRMRLLKQFNGSSVSANDVKDTLDARKWQKELAEGARQR